MATSFLLYDNVISLTKSLHFLVLRCVLKCKLVLYLCFLLHALLICKALIATIGLYFLNIDQSCGPDRELIFSVGIVQGFDF